MLQTTNPFTIPSPLPSSIAYSSVHNSLRFSPSCNSPLPGLCFWNIDLTSLLPSVVVNTGDADDRIIANPDGALAIITNKKSGPAFEAKKADIKWVEALMAKGLDRADAKAHATAAQIWAEMLGLVCHPKYYKLGDQMAFVVHFNGFHACIYYATFSTEYLFTIQHEGIHALKSKFDNPLPLYHTEPCNLLHPDARLHFIQDFIAIIRCLADGRAPIEYLRRDDLEGKIHRKLNDEDEVVRPPQQALEQRKESEWRQEKGSKYGV